MSNNWNSDYYRLQEHGQQPRPQSAGDGTDTGFSTGGEGYHGWRPHNPHSYGQHPGAQAQSGTYPFPPSRHDTGGYTGGYTQDRPQARGPLSSGHGGRGPQGYPVGSQGSWPPVLTRSTDHHTSHPGAPKQNYSPSYGGEDTGVLSDSQIPVISPTAVLFRHYPQNPYAGMSATGTGPTVKEEESRPRNLYHIPSVPASPTGGYPNQSAPNDPPGGWALKQSVNFRNEPRSSLVYPKSDSAGRPSGPA